MNEKATSAGDDFFEKRVQNEMDRLARRGRYADRPDGELGRIDSPISDIALSRLFEEMLENGQISPELQDLGKQGPTS